MDSGFRAVDSGFQVLDSKFFYSGTWILDSNRYWDSGFLKMYSGVQSPIFRTQKKKKKKKKNIPDPQAKISRIPNSTSKNFSDSRFHKQELLGFPIPQTRISRIPDSTSKNFPDSRFHKQKFLGFQILVSEGENRRLEICLRFASYYYPSITV